MHLKEWARSTGMRAEEIADMVGVHHRTIRRAFAGGSVSGATGLALSVATGIPLTSLLKPSAPPVGRLPHVRRAPLRPKYKHTCRACGAMATRAGGRCRPCEVAARDTAETRRANFAARVEKIRAGAPCARAWAGYPAERRAQIEAENPDLTTTLNEIRRERERPVFRECLSGCYLIQCETTGLVKIGHSNDVNDRLRTFRVCSPTKLAVLGVLGQDLDAGRDMEATLHARFAHRWSHGEWYALTADEIAETLCGSVTPEPGSHRAAKRAAAIRAARATRMRRPDLASTDRPTTARYVGGPHLTHLRSWAVAEGYAKYTQKELAALCGVTQGSVSSWLRAADVVAQKRHFFDESDFLASVFAS